MSGRGGSYSGGVLHDAGGLLVGAWLVDAGDRLRPDHATSPRDTVRREIVRDGESLRFTRMRTRTAPGPGQRGVTENGDTPQGWLRHVARAWDIVDAIIPGASFASLLGAAMPRALGPWPPRADEPGDMRDLADALLAVEPFVRTLDPRAVALVLSGTLTSRHAGAYALLDATCVPGAPLAAALETHPHWKRTLVDVATRHPEILRDAVGPGALDDMLRARLVEAERIDAPTAKFALELAKRLDDLGAADLDLLASAAKPSSTRRTDPAASLAPLLATLPPDWIPSDVEGWRALAPCLPALVHARHQAPPGHRAALLDPKGDWTAFQARLTAAHGGESGRLAARLRDMADHHGSYARQVLEPAVALAKVDGVGLPPFVPRGAATRLLADGRRLCRQLDDSRRWHAAQARILGDLAAFAPVPDAPRAWPPAWPEWGDGDLLVRELTTAAELMDEGAAGTDIDGCEGLHHCVGGYAASCLAGSSRILSIRRVAGDAPGRLSTVEVALRPHPKALQHLGRRNAAPPSAATSALAIYMGLVQAGDLPVDRGALHAVRGSGRMSVQAGYDFAAPGAWDRARDLWDPFVPRRLRGIGFGSLARAAAVMVGSGWRPVADALP